MLLAGLGNPGREYSQTRHNVGFRVIDLFALRHGIPLNRSYCRGRSGTGMVCGRTVTVLKPRTYMNLSGESVSCLAGRLKLKPSEIVVIHDDMDLDLGQIRIRLKGSSGGHKGVQSVIDVLGTEGFARLRIGIGRPPEGVDPVEFVLGRFGPREEEVMAQTISRAVDALERMISDGFERAMTEFNRCAG